MPMNLGKPVQNETIFNPFGPKQPPPPSIFDAYGGSIRQTGDDYGEIMQNYRDALKTSNISSAGSPVQRQSVGYTPTEIPKSIAYNPVTAKLASYKQSGDTTSALSDLRNLSETGGYSAADQANIRARGTSPIRSVYATAQSDLQRQKALQGGYSPNSAAASARMARDMSGKLSEATTNVNAQLAELIASGKLAGSNAYAGASSAEASRASDVAKSNAELQARIDLANSSGATDTGKFNADLASKIALANQQGKMETDRFNATGQLETDRFNASRQDEANRRAEEARKGMLSLYGTTPALASTFGNQAMEQQKINNQATQHAAELKQKTGSALIDAYRRNG